MLFDKLPALLRPFTSRAFTPSGQALMNRLRVPQTLGEENRKLVAGSPPVSYTHLDVYKRQHVEIAQANESGHPDPDRENTGPGLLKGPPCNDFGHSPRHRRC